MNDNTDQAVTEGWGDFTATTHILEADDGGRFALTHLRGLHESRGNPVICLPGMFTSRHFWVSRKGVGLAAYLVEQGYDLWLVERRRIGASPRRSKGRPGLAEQVLTDLLLVQVFVDQRNPRPAFWMGHSFGGVAVALAVSGRLQRDRVAGLILFATQFEVGKKMLAWPLSLFTRLLVRIFGKLRGRWVGMGSENEPRTAVLDACRWVQLAQGKDDRMQRALMGITEPVLAIVGAGDTVDPPEGCQRFVSHMRSQDKTVIVAGTASGYSVEYQHPAIVVSKPAQQEIWPQVLDWLHTQTGVATQCLPTPIELSEATKQAT